MYLYLGLMFMSLFCVLSKKNFSKKTYNNFFLFYLLFLFLFVGLRTVGSDYQIYERYFYSFQNSQNFSIRPGGDLVYDYLNYILSTNNFPFFTITLITSGIFMFALWLLLKDLPDPFLGLFFAMPYYIINFSMSAIRQTLALSFLIFALFFLKKNKKIFFYLSIMLGGLFHKTLFIFLIIGSIYKKISLYHLIISLIILLAAFFYMQEEFIRMFNNYFWSKQHLVSNGVYIRSIPIFLSILIFYYFYKKKISIFERDKETLLVITFLFFIFFPFILIDTTAADRLLTYIGIFQVIIFARFINFFEHQNKTYYFLLSFFIISYVFYFIAWFKFGNTAFQWENYRSILNLL